MSRERRSAGVCAVVPALVVAMTLWTAAARGQGGWSSIDINAATGTTTLVSGVFTIEGDGAGTSGTADGFRFVYRPWTGDCEIVARVTSQTQTHDWARAGVMIRQSLDAASPFVQMDRNPGVPHGVEFQLRQTAGGQTESNYGGGLNALPRWVRLRRVGNTVSGFQAPDIGGRPGRWAQQGVNVTAPMSDPVYIGLGVSSHSTETLSRAAFDHVTAQRPNPYEPTLELVSYTQGRAWALFVEGNLAYIGDEPLIRILDVTTPTAPVSLGTGPSLPDWTEDIWVSGQYAYLAQAYFGLEILDVSDPTAPTYVGGIDLPGFSFNLQVCDNLAYVAIRFDGWAIVDVSDPTSPTLVTIYDTPGECGNLLIDCAGNLAYITDEGPGLWIFDVTDPTSPTTISNLDTPGLASGLCLVDSLLYLTDYTGGFDVVDVSNPAAPSIVGSIDSWGLGRTITVVGNLAYLAAEPTDDMGGLQIFDVSNPASPILIACHRTPGYPVRVVVSGGLIFHTAWLDEGGLWIFRWSEAAPRTASHAWSLYR